MPSSTKSSPEPELEAITVGFRRLLPQVRLVRTEEGQAAAEVALVVPLVATMLLAIVQVGFVVRDQVLVVHAAREAARAAAVDPRPGAAGTAAAASSALKGARLSTETVTSHMGRANERSDIVTVRVTYRSATDVPLVGTLLPEITLHSKAAMRIEY